MKIKESFIKLSDKSKTWVNKHSRALGALGYVCLYGGIWVISTWVQVGAIVYKPDIPIVISVSFTAFIYSSLLYLLAFNRARRTDLRLMQTILLSITTCPHCGIHKVIGIMTEDAKKDSILH